MKAYYYCTDGTTVSGPVSFDELTRLKFSGDLGDMAQVCEQGTDLWMPLATLIAAHKQQEAARTLSQQHTAAAPATGYIKSTLNKGETVIYAAHVHWGIYLTIVPAFIAAEIFFAFIVYGSGIVEHFPWTNALLLIPFLILPFGYIIQKTTELAVTNRRVIAKVGLVSRKTSEILLNKVESVEVQQGILGRLLNYGTVTVRGTGGGSAPAVAIADPLRFRQEVQRMTENE
jgi:hypothetical protein